MRKCMPTEFPSAAHGTNIETTDKIGLRRVQSQTCLSYAETMVNFGEANRLQTTDMGEGNREPSRVSQQGWAYRNVTDISLYMRLNLLFKELYCSF